MKSKGERTKTNEITICALLECQWNTFPSSVLRSRIAVANWVLGRVIETGEREAEPYVASIASWRQIVLGWLDKGWGGRDGRVGRKGGKDETEGGEGKGREIIKLHLFISIQP